MNVPASVAARLARYDRDARLRWAGDRWAIEHKGRDGRWVYVGSMRPELLGDGTQVIASLHANDIWRQGGGAQVAHQLDQNDATRQEQQHARRLQEFVDQAREARDDLHRRQGHAVFNQGVPK